MLGDQSEALEVGAAPMKRCTKCGNEYPATAKYFYRQKNCRDGLAYDCKQCNKERGKRWYAANLEITKERSRRWRTANPEKAKEIDKRWYADNPEKVREKSRRRYAANPEKAKEKKRQWRAANPEKAKEAGRRWHAANPEITKERSRRWRAANPEKVKETGRQWHVANPEKVKVNSQRRRARKRLFPDIFTVVDWNFACDYFSNRCACCDREASDNLVLAMDHWIPLTSPNCPGTIPKNIIPLCHGIRGCNNSKRDKDAVVWLVEKFGEQEAQRILDRIETYFRSLDEAPSAARR